MPAGFACTVMVFVTTFVPVAITDTDADPELATYAVVPLGVTTMPCGEVPTGTVAMTAFVAVLMTETLLDPAFATYTDFPA